MNARNADPDLEPLEMLMLLVLYQHRPDCVPFEKVREEIEDLIDDYGSVEAAVVALKTSIREKRAATAS